MTIPMTSPNRQQQGVSLIFALVTLAALSLAAVALVRSVNTSSLIVGNLGFKQDTIAYASQASEKAIDYLQFNLKNGVLDSDDPDMGYFATAKTALDPANRRPTDPARILVDWNRDGCATGYDGGTIPTCLSQPVISVSNAAGDNKTRYIITRLCSAPGLASDPANSCARPVAATLNEGGEKGELNYLKQRPASLVGGGPYYRIVVRSIGARNTVSYTETLVHF